MDFPFKNAVIVPAWRALKMAENELLELAKNQLKTKNYRIMLNALFAFDKFSKEDKAHFIAAVENEMESSAFFYQFSKAVLLKWLAEKNRC